MPTNPSLLIVPYRFKAAKLYSQLPESGAGDFVVTRSTTATRTNASGLLESVASGVPRLDYQGGGCPALLVEPAATNLFQNSEWAGGGSTPSGWSTPFSTGTSAAATSTLNPSVAAYLLTTAGTRMVFSQNISQTSGTVYTLSVYVEQVVSGSLSVDNLLGYNFSVAGIATYLEDGIVVGSSHLVQSGKRYSLRITAPSTASVQTRVGNGIGAVATASVRLSMPQIETGSVSTSFILSPIGSTATRNADVISVSSVSGLIGQTQGTLYAEVDVRNFQVNGRILAISDDSSGNRVVLVLNTSSRITAIVSEGAVSQANINTSSLPTGIYKIAFAYAANDFVLYVNGSQIGTDTSGTIPACSSIYLGKQESSSSSNFLNDRIRAAAIYTSRLSNAELETLTTL